MKATIARIAPTVVAVSVASMLTAGGTAYAAHLIGSKDIKNNSIRSIDIRNGAVKHHDLSAGLQAKIATPGTDGKDGRDGLAGAVYRVENFQNGGTSNAAVACADTEEESMKYTAIAGGVQAGTTGISNDFGMTASFPGRMDWDTGEPKVGRLDGWVVLGTGGYSETLKVWALCVPTTSIPVQTRDLNN